MRSPFFTSEELVISAPDGVFSSAYPRSSVACGDRALSVARMRVSCCSSVLTRRSTAWFIDEVKRSSAARYPSTMAPGPVSTGLEATSARELRSAVMRFATAPRILASAWATPSRSRARSGTIRRAASVGVEAR